jgi:acyl-CoA dehydrogenase
MKELPVFAAENIPGLTANHLAIRDAVRSFVQSEITPNVAHWDEASAIPRELHNKAGAIGFLGLGYDERYGGTVADWRSRSLSTIEIARSGSGGISPALMSHTIMVWPILTAGSESVKSSVLPKLFSGEAIGSLAITEADGGSDVARMRTTATQTSNGGWQIDGSKMYITSGMRADYILVAARTGGQGSSGISLFLMPGSTQGLTRTALNKTGWWCSDTAALYFDACQLPANSLIGEVDKGFGLVMQNFNAERFLMAVSCVGYSMVMCEEALAWAQQRKTFGQTLVNHQVIRQKLVSMIEATLAARAWSFEIAAQLDAGIQNTNEPDKALAKNAAQIGLLKNHCGRLMRDCADSGIQILGGAGYVRGTASERLYREVKIMMIGGGAEEIMADLAAKQLGII